MSTNSIPGITSPTKPSHTTNTKPNRLPAPTLFVGPPSRNASQISVARPGTGDRQSSNRPDLARQKSTRARGFTGGDKDGPTEDLPTLKKPSEKSVEAKWREMQGTLNEVELTAQSSTHVFGTSHAKALDELREAQISLARAWGRGNTDATGADTLDAATSGDIGAKVKGAEDLAAERQKTTQQHQQRRRADTGLSEASTTLSDESAFSEGSRGTRSGRSQLEDETAQDIQLAGERRAANEAYFKKVDQGVKEVVEKLERVAEAMRDVEAESRSLWSASDTTSSSLPTEGSGSGRRVPAISKPVGAGG